VLKINGQADETSSRTERIERVWQPNDEVEMILDMPVRQMVAHPNIKDCQGKIALQRGPIVYGFEALDNPGPAQLMLAEHPACKLERRPDLLEQLSKELLRMEKRFSRCHFTHWLTEPGLHSKFG
jgi:DUF1680 family protein